jgi:hypothetical protein
MHLNFDMLTFNKWVVCGAKNFPSPTHTKIEPKFFLHFSVFSAFEIFAQCCPANLVVVVAGVVVVVVDTAGDTLYWQRKPRYSFFSDVRKNTDIWKCMGVPLKRHASNFIFYIIPHNTLK